MMDSSLKDENQQQILGPRGIPIPPQITWRERWNSFSKRARLILISLVALVAATAAFLTNLHTIKDYFGSIPKPLSVPPIVVAITNSSKEPIIISARGDFYLWLLGLDARHTIGKFELHRLNGSPSDTGTFTVAPSAKIRVLAHVMNQDLYRRILEQADCDIAFMIHKAKGEHRTTEDMPFTRDAIAKFFTTVDIGTE